MKEYEPYKIYITYIKLKEKMYHSDGLKPLTLGFSMKNSKLSCRRKANQSQEEM